MGKCKAQTEVVEALKIGVQPFLLTVLIVETTHPRSPWNQPPLLSPAKHQRRGTTILRPEFYPETCARCLGFFSFCVLSPFSSFTTTARCGTTLRSLTSLEKPKSCSGDSEQSHNERRNGTLVFQAMSKNGGWFHSEWWSRKRRTETVRRNRRNPDSERRFPGRTPVAGWWYHGAGVSPATRVVVGSTVTGDEFLEFRARIWGLRRERKEGAEWVVGVWGDQIWVVFIVPNWTNFYEVACHVGEWGK
ncbi:hypothetical protein Fot_41178 [Forsythia ovata]|uniref:Uncharacterized protein n=1 Tax=Forsythia ovata TaxID=205694 RepID=A0ABD1RIL4_9LAMI